jgi:hypothetical protein
VADTKSCMLWRPLKGSLKRAQAVRQRAQSPIEPQAGLNISLPESNLQNDDDFPGLQDLSPENSEAIHLPSYNS